MGIIYFQITDNSSPEPETTRPEPQVPVVVPVWDVDCAVDDADIVGEEFPDQEPVCRFAEYCIILQFHTMYCIPFSFIALNFDPFLTFSGFSAKDFYNITHLTEIATSINDWMSANFLSLNLSKTECLVIGYPKQLA